MFRFRKNMVSLGVCVLFLFIVEGRNAASQNHRSAHATRRNQPSLLQFLLLKRAESLGVDIDLHDFFWYNNAFAYRGLHGLHKDIEWKKDPNTGKCYCFLNMRTNWENARAKCRSMGGDLVSIHSEQENNFILSTINGRDRSWIGLTDDQIEGSFTWVDGRSVNYTNWDKVFNEPNNHRAGEDCVEMYNKAGTWNDKNCDAWLPSVCEKKDCDEALKQEYLKTEEPQEEQTKLEDETPSEEIRDHGEETGFLKVTAERVDDGSWHWTKTLNEETADEVYDEKWTMNPSTGKKYLSLDWPMTWAEAREECWGRNSDLVSIHSAEENRFIQTLAKKITWLGLNDRLRENFFSWSDLRPVTYSNWRKDEPNNRDFLGEDCVAIGGTGKWSDISCMSKFYAVCAVEEPKEQEKEPEDGGITPREEIRDHKPLTEAAEEGIRVEVIPVQMEEDDDPQLQNDDESMDDNKNVRWKPWKIDGSHLSFLDDSNKIC